MLYNIPHVREGVIEVEGLKERAGGREKWRGSNVERLDGEYGGWIRRESWK